MKYSYETKIYILQRVIVIDLGHIHSHSRLVLPANIIIFFFRLLLYISCFVSLATTLNHYGKEDYICSHNGGY